MRKVVLAFGAAVLLTIASVGSVAALKPTSVPVGDNGHPAAIPTAADDGLKAAATALTSAPAGP